MVNIFGITHSRAFPQPVNFKNLTKKVITFLTPEIHEGMVTVKDCVIFGKKRSGKTWLEKSLAEKIVEYYGEDNVSVYMSDSFSALAENIDKPTARCANCGSWSLFENGNGTCNSCNENLVGNGEDKKVKVLIVDDPLKRYLSRGGTTKEQREAIGDFEAIAHKLEDKLATKEGVVIIIIGSQQYRGLEKTFRDAPVQIFKTTMGDDQWEVNRKLNYNKKAIEKLRKLTDDVYIKDKHDKRSENIVKVGENVGCCTFEPYQNDYTVFVQEEKEREKKQQETKFERLVNYAKEVRTNTSLTSKEPRAVKGYLFKKHPDRMDEIKKLVPDICAIMAIMEREEKQMKEQNGAGGEENLYNDIKFEKDENGFVWDYWRWRDRLYKILSVNAERRDVRCSLRAYEMVVLRLRPQEEVANALVKEGLAENCTQQWVSQMVKEVKGAVENLKGRVYELYVKDRLKEEVVEGVYDVDKIKEVMHFGEVKTGMKEGNYPDLMALYENGDIDIISCKCFNDKNYTISVEDESKCTIKPELKMFEKLHRGEEAKLPDGRVLMKDGNNVRLVLMLQSTNEQLPVEVYKVYEKPEELPQSLSFSKRKIDNKVLHIAKWCEKIGGRPKKILNERTLFRLRGEGKSIREIAKHMNASVDLVHRALKEGDREMKTGGSPIKEADNQIIFKMREEGKTIRQIAKKVKLSPASVHKRLQEREIEERGRGRPRVKVDKRRIYHLRNEGYSLREIAKKLNISKDTVHRILKG